MVGIAAGKGRRQNDPKGRELITISMWTFVYHNICKSQELKRNRTEKNVYYKGNLLCGRTRDKLCSPTMTTCMLEKPRTFRFSSLGASAISVCAEGLEDVWGGAVLQSTWRAEESEVKDRGVWWP